MTVCEITTASIDTSGPTTSTVATADSATLVGLPPAAAVTTAKARRVQKSSASRNQVSGRGIKRGVQRPLRRMTEVLLHKRRTEFVRRLARHDKSLERNKRIVEKYDAEMGHRGIVLGVEPIAPVVDDCLDN